MAVTYQRTQDVMMRIAERVTDRNAHQRMRTDLYERGVAGRGLGDGPAELHRVAQVGHPMLGVE